jgi:hypothetical protein
LIFNFAEKILNYPLKLKDVVPKNEVSKSQLLDITRDTIFACRTWVKGKAIS